MGRAEKAKWIAVFFLAGFAATALVCIAQEAAMPAAAPVPATEAGPSKWQWLLSLEALWNAVGLIGAALVGWIFKIIISTAAKTDSEREAFAALEQAIVETYQEFVSLAKDAASDGKLTAEEKIKARELAYSKAMAIAKGPALALLQAWGKPRIMALIERIVAKYKGAPAPESAA